MLFFCSSVWACLAPLFGDARFPGDPPRPGDGVRRFPFDAAAGWDPDCWAFIALLGESPPRGDLRGEFLGELFWEAPGLEGDRRFPGEPRKEGRVLGETDRKPPPGEREADRAFDGERDR